MPAGPATITLAATSAAGTTQLGTRQYTDLFREALRAPTDVVATYVDFGGPMAALYWSGTTTATADFPEMTESTVSVYAIDPATGALTKVGGDRLCLQVDHVIDSFSDAFRAWVVERGSDWWDLNCDAFCGFDYDGVSHCFLAMTDIAPGSGTRVYQLELDEHTKPYSALGNPAAITIP